MGLNEGWIGLSDTGVSGRRMISGLLLHAKGPRMHHHVYNIGRMDSMEGIRGFVLFLEDSQRITKE